MALANTRRNKKRLRNTRNGPLALRVGQRVRWSPGVMRDRDTNDVRNTGEDQVQVKVHQVRMKEGRDHGDAVHHPVSTRPLTREGGTRSNMRREVMAALEKTCEGKRRVILERNWGLLTAPTPTPTTGMLLTMEGLLIAMAVDMAEKVLHGIVMTITATETDLSMDTGTPEIRVSKRIAISFTNCSCDHNCNITMN